MTTKKTNEATRTTWIVVSGLDGSGKTTLVDNLEKYLLQENLRVKRSRLPHNEYLVKELLDVSTNSYTDRMLFALDNRIFAERYRQWESSGDYNFILTQRGFLDSFVHGAVQGYSYSWVAEFNQIASLPKCHVIIHLVAEAETAYSRIKDDPDADKFEYIDYIRKQESETRRAYSELCKGNVDLKHFDNAINIYIDTTQLTTEETFEMALKRLREHKVI